MKAWGKIFLSHFHALLIINVLLIHYNDSEVKSGYVRRKITVPNQGKSQVK